MPRLLPLRPLALATALLAAAVSGQDKRPASGPIDERLFLLYALEDMHRTSLPETSGQRAGNTPGHVVVSHFVAQRQLLFDRLRRHAEKRKTDEGILQGYRDYERELELWASLKAALDKSVEKHLPKSPGETLPGDRTTPTGVSYGLRSVPDGTDGEAAFLKGFAALSAVQIEEQTKADKARGEAWKRMTDEQLAAVKAFLPRRLAVRKENDSRFKGRVKELTSHGLKDAEFFYRRPRSASASNNPFLILDAARRVLARTKAGTEELLEQANGCARAADLVPKDRVYNYYRAAAFGVAALLATRAAAKDLGTAGFVDAIKNKPKGGVFAKKSWDGYLKNEPIDHNVTDEVVHGYVRACGYAGKCDVAYAVILQTVVHGPQLRTRASKNPEFWYDCARVCSVQKQPALAVTCLEQAVRLGFKDLAAAKVSPDLKNVRDHRATADRFTRLVR